jgi:hypothetical protein
MLVVVVVLAIAQLGLGDLAVVVMGQDLKHHLTEQMELLTLVVAVAEAPATNLQGQAALVLLLLDT